VLQAAGGEAALRVARHYGGRIDLLLTDVIMPGMDGPSLAEALAPARPETQVLFISGHGGKALSQRGISATDLRILGKPFTSVALKEKVRAVLHSAKAVTV
jgi:two-component system cell cycle sensor histidine kinase/response regulator CckA